MASMLVGHLRLPPDHATMPHDPAQSVLLALLVLQLSMSLDTASAVALRRHCHAQNSELIRLSLRTVPIAMGEPSTAAVVAANGVHRWPAASAVHAVTWVRLNGFKRSCRRLVHNTKSHASN